MAETTRLDGIEALLVDIDGVLTLSWEPIDGAASAVATIRQAGLPIRFLTNTTSLSRAEVTDRLREADIAAEPDDVLTAPVATAAWIVANRPGVRCHLLNSGDLSADLADLELVPADQAADIVLLGGAGPEFSYEAVNRAVGLLLGGADLVAMHRNRYWRTAAGFALDTGGFVAALEAAAGVEATVVGKPSSEFFATALGLLGVTAERALMVGDDLETDVLAAQGLGIHAALVRTGKFRVEALDEADATPEVIIDSFAAVPALLDLT